MKYFTAIIFSVLWLLGCSNDEKVVKDSIKLDQIDQLIKDSFNLNFSTEDRIKSAEKAFYFCEDLPNDLEKRNRYSDISRVYLRLKDYERFKRSNKRTLELAKQIGDTVGLASSYNRLGIYYQSINNLDSAYVNFFKSAKTYERIKNKSPYGHGKSLLSMALIEQETKDYATSQASTIEAIKKFELAGNADLNLSICYSNLGILLNNLEDYDNAILYHRKSIEDLRLDKKRVSREVLAYNNMGIVYKNQEKYKKAIENYYKALDYKEYLDNKPGVYALLLDNLAYMKFLSGERIGVHELFTNALNIRDSIDDKSGISINTLHLAEYYQAIGDDSTASLYAIRAMKVSDSINYNPNLLKSYQLLSEISDSEEGLQYAKKYIWLNDSLVKEERSFRDKFARIRFETDEIEEQNLQISKENQALIIAVLGLTALFLLVYIIFRQQQSNKELLFSQAQQESNQEIYRLLLNQQVKLEEGRQIEQQRMSEELHDGVLGRLFGVRLSLDGINQRANDGFTETRTKYIEELKSIEKEIRLISHDLGTETISPEVAYIDAVESLISDLCEAHKLDFEFKNDENIDWEEIDDQKKINLFRILQESLQNIFKHAKAKMVKISFDYVDNNINLVILDDGIGFRKNKVKKGIGLKNITSRVSQMSGIVDFISNKGAGTSVSVSIPT